MTRKAWIVGVGVLAAAGALVWAQQAQHGRHGPGSLLRQWEGHTCTVYLRMESDPRSGQSSFSGGSADGLRHVEDTPISVHGLITGVSDDGLTLVNGNSVYWIPRDQVRVISGFLNP